MKILFGLAILLMGGPAQAPESLESLMKALSSDGAAARAEAACRIGRLGFRAERAVTPLVELLSDASVVEDIACGHRGWHNDAGRWETSPGRQAAVPGVSATPSCRCFFHPNLMRPGSGVLVRRFRSIQPPVTGWRVRVGVTV